jgi:hypothetical protein
MTVWLSGWQNLLSLVTPPAFALLLCLLERHGPLAAFLQKPVGLVAPYFGCIAVLFGLVTALLMADVWQKDSAASQSVQAEDDAVRALLHLARADGIEAAIVPDLKAYAAAAAKENPYSRADQTARVDTDRAYEALLRTLSGAPGLDTPMRGRLLDVGAELRQARSRRLYLADDETATIKWLSVLVLGALTQIAIVLVHAGNKQAIRISVGLFTVAFTFCLMIVGVFDQPFELVLANEPGTTLGRTLKGL